MAGFLTPPLFDAPAEGNPLEFLHESYPAKTRVIHMMIKLHNPNFNRVMYCG